jgi:hypothetical protein
VRNRAVIVDGAHLRDPTVLLTSEDSIQARSAPTL